MNPTPHCYAITAGAPFLRRLAEWVLARYGDNPQTLSGVLLLLPNRRACRSMREIFLDVTHGAPLLLPRLSPIGELEGEALSIYAEGLADVPPAIIPMRRQLLLMRLVMDFEKKQGRLFDVAQSSELARQLARFMDDVAREGADFKNLGALAPEQLAEHWQQTLDFLKIVSEHWPKILHHEEMLDPVTHRNLLLRALADRWRKNSPSYPVIAAGSTGSQPATALLMAAIARLPQGFVMLPALDMAMPEEEWRLLGETHPQYALKTLLHALGCKRGEVKLIPNMPERGEPHRTPHFVEDDRIFVLRTVFQPPEITAHWRNVQMPLEGVSGISLVEADTLADEARMIAAMLREALETPEKTAALVTQNRDLARMVANQMRRFGIEIDDSAGQILSKSVPGCFMRLALEMVASQAAPANLLALLRHPFAKVGVGEAECRRLSRHLELDLLRGLRKTPGLKALKDAASDPALVAFLENLEAITEPLAQLFKKKSVSLTSLVDAHIAFVQALSDEKILWAGEAGNCLAEFLADLKSQSALLGAIDPISYPALFETLLSGEYYWPLFGLHPRLHILSPMEARLQHFDLAILGGLNEGSWPAHATADPWMSRPMRKHLGLSAPERLIGQSAHDFFMLAASPEVVLTRARKEEGVPSVPSRWLVRLKTLIKGLDEQRFAKLFKTGYYEQAVAVMDAPTEMSALAAPAPTPILAARPRSLRVTAIDTWLRDPYVVYANAILKLRPLDPLDQEPDAADFGMIVHQALERFISAFPKELPIDAKDQLLSCGRIAFSNYIDRPAVAAIWWPRFEAMGDWLLEVERKRRFGIQEVRGEIKGEWQFDVDGKTFVLTTRIDRIEIGKDGALAIADYKTGTLPTKSEIERGLANQLLLESLIVANGALSPAIPIQQAPVLLEYWKLSGTIDACEIMSVDSAHVEQARERLIALIRHFDNPATPYEAQTDPSLRLRYNDYEHLTRRQEWETL